MKLLSLQEWSHQRKDWWTADSHLSVKSTWGWFMSRLLCLLVHRMWIYAIICLGSHVEQTEQRNMVHFSDSAALRVQIVSETFMLFSYLCQKQLLIFQENTNLVFVLLSHPEKDCFHEHFRTRMVVFRFRGNYLFKTTQMVETEPKLCKYFKAENRFCSKCVEILYLFAEFREI